MQGRGEDRETTKRPVIAPTQNKMKQIVAHMNKRDSLSNLETRVMVGFASRTPHRPSLDKHLAELFPI